MLFSEVWQILILKLVGYVIVAILSWQENTSGTFSESGSGCDNRLAVFGDPSQHNMVRCLSCFSMSAVLTDCQFKESNPVS